MEPPNQISPPVKQPRIIPWEEQLQDHNAEDRGILPESRVPRLYDETTVKTARDVLKRLFDGLQIEDPNHPRGRRQILVWELYPRARLIAVRLTDVTTTPRESGTWYQARSTFASCDRFASTYLPSLISRAVAN